MTIREVFQSKMKLSYFLVSLFAITLLTHCSEDDDPQIVENVTVTNVSDEAGFEGTPIVHTVTFNGTSTEASIFAASLTDGTATSDNYDPDLSNAILSNGVTYSSGELTVPSGVSSFTIGINTIKNNVDEEDKTYSLMVGTQSGTGTITDNDLAPAYIVQNTVQAPDAPRTIYLNVLSDLTDEIDLADAFEFNGNSRVRVFNGKVYIFDSERVLIIKHSISENNVLVEEDRFSLAQLGVGGFLGIIAFVNDEYALLRPSGGRQFVVWNPTTMEVRNTIDFPADSPDSFITSNIGTVSVSPDGKVFIGVAGFSFGALPNNTPGARVMIVDPVAGSVDVVFNENIAAGTEGAFDGQGNYYFSANAYFGFSRYFASPAEVEQTMTRIKPGELSFDSEFNIPATSIGGLNRPQNSILKIIGNEFLLGVLDLTEDELGALVNPFDLATGAIKLLRGNLENWEAAVEVPFSDGNKTMTDLFVVDGSFYGVARDFSDSSVGSESDIYRFTESNTLEKLTTGVGWVEYIERVR
ncbi:MAG: hypothetical protein AAGG59_07395 [Bacteroidota bacterium]